MDNNGTRIGFVITRSRRRRSNPQLHMYFWIATKIFDFLAMTSVCINTDLVSRPFSCHSENVEK